MKIQTPTEFLTFKDGKCIIYNVKGNQLAEPVEPLDFGNRTVGIKRFYAARAATTQVDRLIHVPQRLNITAMQNVVIDGARFKIEQIQQLYDTNPWATVLTLHRIGVMS
jgi:hypothetical protein